MADVTGLTNALNTITNSSTQAYLLIKDKRPTGMSTVTKKGAVDPGSASSIGGMSIPSGATDALNKVADATGVKDKINEKIDKIAGSLEYDKVFSVQFNPATLRINGFSGGAFEAVDYRNQGNSAKTAPLNPTLTMGVTLLFDQMSLANSFPVDNIDTSISSMTSKMIQGVTESLKGYSISVQAAVEGLIGVLRNPNTRQVCFSWGSLRYKGTLRQVDATYTMFDMLGRPVRAQVALSIYLMDEEIKKSGKKNALGMWASAYNSAFSDATAYGTTMADKAKKWSKLVTG